MSKNTAAINAVTMYAKLGDKEANKLVADKIANVATTSNVHREFWLLCIGQGMRAAKENDGSMNVSRLWDTFKEKYYGKGFGGDREPLTEKTEENYRSGFASAMDAGKHQKFDAIELAVRVIDTEKLGNVGARGTLMRKILEQPTLAAAKKKASEILVAKDRKTSSATIVSASASMNRTVVEFGAKWFDTLNPELQKTYQTLSTSIKEFAEKVAKDHAAPKPEKTTKGTTKETFKEREKALRAKMAEATGIVPSGVRTLQ